MSAPLGVLLFILKSIDKSAEKEETAAAQAQADYRSDLGPATAQTAPRQENEPAYGHDVPTKAVSYTHLDFCFLSVYISTRKLRVLSIQK